MNYSEAIGSARRPQAVRIGGAVNIQHLWPALRRWLWLILLLGIIPPVLVGARLKPTYTAITRLQMTAPPSVDVALFPQSDPYRNLRDELTVARVDFIEAAKSGEVRSRTVAALALSDADADYSLDVKQVRDSDFIDLTVQARTADLAQRIANAHADASIGYASELRALPAKATVAFLARRVQDAQADVEAATNADAARAAQDNLKQLQNKLTEAQLKADGAYSAQSMQVVARATAPLSPDTRKVQMLIIASGVGGLVLGAALGFILDGIALRLDFFVRRVSRRVPLRV